MITDRQQGGFTVIELSSVLVVNGILAVAFASILYINQDHSASIQRKIDIHNDIKVLNSHINSFLLRASASSILIYSDSDAEDAGTPSNSGTILTAGDFAGDSLRISASGNQLVWQKNATTINPLTSSVNGLTFSRNEVINPGYYHMMVNLVQNTDTMQYVKSFTPRN